ncbi:MAG: V-type ATPase subunit [Firmicutes bacterium]|jgi:V/A-type H+-transporting ATPase subunit C|nr:V-type ATPase subunit [Bacillota bacterium]MDH7495966.1 V-type ATPase subunit [Bacillota bacterium]
MLGLESRYAYATGRVRVLETRLLDRGRIDRMIEAPDLEGALKVLAEAGYARAQVSGRSLMTVDEITSSEEARLARLIQETAPEPGLVELVTARWDFHNLKAMMKAKLHRVPPEKAVARHGACDLALIERAVEGDGRGLPAQLAEALSVARAAHELRPTPETIDIAVDREMYRYLLAKANSLRIRYLVDLIQTEIDLFNLAVYFRSRRMGRDRRLAEQAMAPGGKLSPLMLMASYDQPLEAVATSVAGTGYEALAGRAAGALAEGRPIAELERMSEELMWERIRKARYVPLGPEPLVGYIFAKLYELRLVRLILVEKLSGVSRDTIRERLRDVSV